MSALVVPAASSLALTGLSNTSAVSSTATTRSDLNGPLSKTVKERAVNYDARSADATSLSKDAAALVAKRGPGFAAFAKSLGSRAVMDYDAVTGTPRNL